MCFFFLIAYVQCSAQILDHTEPTEDGRHELDGTFLAGRAPAPPISFSRKQVKKVAEWNSLSTEFLYVTVNVRVNFLVLLKINLFIKEYKVKFYLVTSLYSYFKIFSSLNKNFHCERCGPHHAFF